MMYAVFELSGFQFKVEEGAVVKVPRQNLDEGAKLDIDRVLLISGEGDPIVGAPFVADAKVEAEVISHGKNDRIIIYKYKRRTKYRRTQGHRQDVSEIRINKIVCPAS